MLIFTKNLLTFEHNEIIRQSFLWKHFEVPEHLQLKFGQNPPMRYSENPLMKIGRFLAQNGLRIFSAVHERIFKFSKHGERPWQTLQKTSK